MDTKSRGGRPSIFRPKTGGRIQGDLTVPGSSQFEARRQEIQALVGRSAVSDADVMESFIRGMDETRKVIASLGE